MTSPTMIQAKKPNGTVLSEAEQRQLSKFETVIKSELQSFVKVGNALLAIRDGKLYRGTHKTFKDYCRERWDISRSYAHRTIDAAEVVGNLSPIGNILPANESQARPLTRLKPEQQIEAWQQAVDDAGGEQPTATQVQKAADEIAPEMPRELKRLRAGVAKAEPEPKPKGKTTSASMPTSEPPAPNQNITVAIPQPLLAALHSDLLAHYPNRKLTLGDQNTLAGILYRALEGEGSDD